MLQRGLAWLLSFALLATTVYGLFAQRLFSQSVWQGDGVLRLAIAAALYTLLSAALIAFKPKWFLPGLAIAAFLYTSLAVGPLAPLAVAYMGIACFATGAIWYRRYPEFAARAPHLTVLTGVATWLAFVLLTARWPIHFRAVYWLLPIPVIIYALRKQYLPAFSVDYPTQRRDLVPLAAALFPLYCHWLVALKPEASSDGLAMHMVVASRMAYHHRWAFDVSEFIWAVMPMGGDWWFSLGWQLAGEAGARLFNLAILALIVWILYERIHARVPNWITAALVAALLSTPLVQQVTGSLYVENVVAVLILGACLLLRVYVKERRGVFIYAAAFLAGLAGASKFGALAFVFPFLMATVLQVKFRHQVIAFPITLVTASIPYLEALIRTSNPFFPFFNAFFRSPHFSSAQNFRDARFLTPLSPSTWYDLTFHSSRFIEGQDGSFGFFFFLSLPLSLIAIRRRWPRTGFTLLWVAAVGLVLTYLGQSNLRYLYPALPLATLLAGIAIASYRTHSPALGVALGAQAAFLAALNLAFLPAAGWLHKGFALNQVFDRQAVSRYLTETAPERPLVDWLNQHDPSARVAWMEGNAVADFHGTSFTNSWHSDLFYRRLREATAPEGLGWLAQDLKIRYFIAPTPDSNRAVTNVYSREFLHEFTKPVTSFGDMELRRWSPPQPGEPSRLPFAPPGRYDELSLYTRFAGQWTRDLQFDNAYRRTLVYSNDSRSRLLIRFDGTSVRLIYTAAANRCKGLVSIDEGEESTLQEFSEQTRWQAVSEPFVAAAPGRHLLQLRFPQDKSKTAIGGCYLDLDGFIVE